VTLGPQLHCYQESLTAFCLHYHKSHYHSVFLVGLNKPPTSVVEVGVLPYFKTQGLGANWLTFVILATGEVRSGRSRFEASHGK
jgi:hypothetical protein